MQNVKAWAQQMLADPNLLDSGAALLDTTVCSGLDGAQLDSALEAMEQALFTDPDVIRILVDAVEARSLDSKRTLTLSSVSREIVDYYQDVIKRLRPASAAHPQQAFAKLIGYIEEGLLLLDALERAGYAEVEEVRESVMRSNRRIAHAWLSYDQLPKLIKDHQRESEVKETRYAQQLLCLCKTLDGGDGQEIRRALLQGDPPISFTSLGFSHTDGRLHRKDAKLPMDWREYLPFQITSRYQLLVQTLLESLCVAGERTAALELVEKLIDHESDNLHEQTPHILREAAWKDPALLARVLRQQRLHRIAARDEEGAVSFALLSPLSLTRSVDFDMRRVPSFSFMPLNETAQILGASNHQLTSPWGDYADDALHIDLLEQSIWHDAETARSLMSQDLPRYVQTETLFRQDAARTPAAVIARAAELFSNEQLRAKAEEHCARKDFDPRPIYAIVRTDNQAIDQLIEVAGEDAVFIRQIEAGGVSTSRETFDCIAVPVAGTQGGILCMPEDIATMRTKLERGKSDARPWSQPALVPERIDAVPFCGVDADIHEEFARRSRLTPSAVSAPMQKLCTHPAEHVSARVIKNNGALWPLTAQDLRSVEPLYPPLGVTFDCDCCGSRHLLTVPLHEIHDVWDRLRRQMQDLKQMPAYLQAINHQRLSQGLDPARSIEHLIDLSVERRVKTHEDLYAQLPPTLARLQVLPNEGPDPAGLSYENFTL